MWCWLRRVDVVIVAVVGTVVGIVLGLLVVWLLHCGRCANAVWLAVCGRRCSVVDVCVRACGRGRLWLRGGRCAFGNV